MISSLNSSAPLVKKLFKDNQADFKELATKLNISSVSNQFLVEIVIPLTLFFTSLDKRENPYFICFTGGQGSGKTTLS